MASGSVKQGEEALATLSDPLPLPPYQFDPILSEDENFLIWVSILARHSTSKKGHMGTIFVRPPEQGDPSDGHPSTDCIPPVDTRIVTYANNYPLLYARIPKAVPEVHAEALAIARCARRGIAVEGCTVYVSFPPCNDCMKLLLSAGIRRCVFKKAILSHTAAGESELVAAQVEGMELVGTTDAVQHGKAVEDREAQQAALQRERAAEEQRDQRVRQFWAQQGEDADKTRARNARWWERYTERYSEADKVVKQCYGTGMVEEQEKQRYEQKAQRRQAKKEQHQRRQGGRKGEKGPEQESPQEADLDELLNGTSVPLKRARDGEGGVDESDKQPRQV